MSKLVKNKLSNVAQVQLCNVDKKTIKDEIPIQLCNYMDVYRNSYIDKYNSQHFMYATCTESEYEKFVLKSGQVAITKDSEKANDIGIPTYIDDNIDNVVLGYHLSLITPNKDKLDGKFLRYWLETRQAKKYFENNAMGSGQRLFLTLNSIKDTPLFLPKLNVQKSISNTLFNLDKKIELNNKINKELEAMAKTLYDYWFVQFDFPDENGKPYKSSGGKMVYNEELKREIPEGWEAANLKNNPLTKILKPKIDNFEGNKIYLATADIQDKNINFNAEVINYNNRPSRANMQPITNSIWFAKMKNSKKNLCCADYSQEFLDNFILSTGFMGLKCKIEALEYLWGFVDNDYFETVKDKLANGATQEAINNDDLIFIKLLIPSDNVLKKYHLQMKSIYQKIYNNKIQNQELSTLRDWLLPMLMNGQVKVK